MGTVQLLLSSASSCLMEPPSVAASISTTTPQPPPGSIAQVTPASFIPSPPNFSEPASAIPQNTTPQSRPQASTPSSANAVGGSNPRLRSSIACARCRRSKIKCTNAGAGTTCEACAHSGRECVYPTPGAVGPAKRDGDGEDAIERVKRSRTKKLDSFPDRINLDYAINQTGFDYGRARAPMPGSDSQGSPNKIMSWQSPALGNQVWNEIFELFQLHYGTELPFLHAPTFPSKLAQDPAQYGAASSSKTQTGAAARDPVALQLLQLGLLTLTARHHDGLIEQQSPSNVRGSSISRTAAAFAASEVHAAALRNALFSGTFTTVEQPTLAKTQALLMLSLYEWSVRRGALAWIHLGLAIRMAQTLDLFSEDMDAAETATGFTNPMAGLLATPSLCAIATGEIQDPDSPESFVQEETRRRTAWSCFLLDRYISNGNSRPSAIQVRDMRVQMPCKAKAWDFDERVCTSFFDGSCSRIRERTKRKAERIRRREEKKMDASITANRPELRTIAWALEENLASRIPCEYDQDESLLSRFVKIGDIWSAVARWSYAGGKSLGAFAPWDSRSNYWPLKESLSKFINEMPRSFRLTKTNSQAHFAQHSLPPFTLVHTIYSICQLVLLRDFLPFAPVTHLSPSELDDNEYTASSNFTQGWYANTIRELFRVSHDFLDLVHTCKARRLLPVTPMTGFGIYLVSFIGIYALHFPQMDVEGAVCGRDQETNIISERQSAIVDALRTLVQMRFHLPMANHWFRTLHRAHRYYKQVANEHTTNPQAFPRPPSAGSRNLPSANRNVVLHETKVNERSEAVRALDNLFKEVGMAEDESAVFSIFRDSETKVTNGFAPPPQEQPLGPTRPPDAWNPVNNNSRVNDPYFTSSSPYPQPYGSRSQPSPPKSNNSPAYDTHSSPYPPPPNTLPPISTTNSNSINPYPPTPSSAPSKPLPSSQLNLTFSGEDIANFIDGRSDEEWAVLKAGWELLRDEMESGPTGNGSPGEGAKDDRRRARASGPGWLGVLWGWV